MDPLQRFGAHAMDFEKTFEDDDWARLEGYFAEDATYTVTGTPFDCAVRGRDAIFRAIKKSIDGFDRRFDKREIVPSGPPVVDGNRVTSVEVDTPQRKELLERLREGSKVEI